jgi:lipopolysaccharide biosynthesis glycosyltransferase
MKNIIHIALSADKSYSIPLALCLYSLEQTANSDTEYHYHILDSGVDHALISLGNFKNISWYSTDKLLQELPCNLRYPTAIYHRYLLPELLPANIERALYLDCDTFVRKDLSQLYHSDMEGNPIAAPLWKVLGPNKTRYQKFLSSFPERFSLPDEEQQYCFSSQLLMDLAALRAMNATSKLTEMTQNFADKLIYPDQDIINAFFYGKITHIGQEYNVIPSFATPEELSADEIQKAYKDPAIIHFASIKPNILTGPRNSYEEEFFLFWQNSPWKNHIPYPLISLTQFPLPCVASLLRGIIRHLIPYPRLLRCFGKLLACLRAPKK